MANLKQEFIDLSFDLINDDFADIAVDVTHVHPTQGSYDSEEGELFETFENTVVKAIVGPFNKTKANAQDVMIGDLQMILPKKNAPLAIDVSVDSMQVASVSYTIIQKTLDAAESTYIIQLRQAK